MFAFLFLSLLGKDSFNLWFCQIRTVQPMFLLLKNQSQDGADLWSLLSCSNGNIKAEFSTYRFDKNVHHHVQNQNGTQCNLNALIQGGFLTLYNLIYKSEGLSVQILFSCFSSGHNTFDNRMTVDTGGSKYLWCLIDVCSRHFCHPY